MTFTDQIQVHMKAGDGGDGVVRWRQEARVDKGGPAGGDGGRGGDIFLRGVRDISLLARYAHKDEFKAENGADGGASNKTGKDGDDLVIDIPLGSVIKYANKQTGFELLEDGEKKLLLEGGAGGKGNTQFKSSTNRTPYQQTDGETGEEDTIQIELKLPVDAGFVGFPNAGKSSLLNELTNADSKTGSYEFTTLSPHLGDFYGHVLADIPGLISGAADGKGLGHDFLRHVTRTKRLIHCISLENENLVAAYEAIRGELTEYGNGLAAKPELVVITKTDVSTPKEVDECKNQLQDSFNVDVVATSILDDESIKNLSKKLSQFLENK